MPDLPYSGFGLLRPMTDADLGRVLAWRNNVSIRANMYTQREITLDEHHAWWERVKDAPKFAFFLYERVGLPLGYVSFSNIEPRPATAMWGFYAAPEAPKGTGSLMTFCAMETAFGPLNLRKLNAEAVSCNAASIGLHESFGFQHEGLFRAQVLIGDALDDVIRLALFAEDWAALRPAKLQNLNERLPQ